MDDNCTRCISCLSEMKEFSNIWISDGSRLCLWFPFWKRWKSPMSVSCFQFRPKGGNPQAACHSRSGLLDRVLALLFGSARELEPSRQTTNGHGARTGKKEKNHRRRISWGRQSALVDGASVRDSLHSQWLNPTGSEAGHLFTHPWPRGEWAAC